MKKIVCFIGSLTSGGAEHQLSILSALLAERGYNVTLATFGEGKDHYAVNDKVKRYRISQGKNGIRKLLGIWWYFLTLKTDCVISFGSRENFFCLIPLLLRKDIKVLAGERGATKNNFFWLKINYNLLYRRADYIVPNNYTQKKEISQSWPFLLDKTHVITNYTDVNEYQIAIPPSNPVIRIGIFCRFAKQKNYQRFAKVVKELKENANTKFEFHWYGNMHSDGKLLSQYVEMDGLRRKYHVEDCLILHDHTKDVANLLKSFDSLCLPSLWEGFSNSISEYICTGRPVICSDVADNSIMVHNGQNGYLFNPEDIYNMVTTFLRFFNHTKEKREEMGRQSRKIAESLFDKEKFINSYIKLIEE